MGGREHEYNREQQPQDVENKRQSGELVKGEEQKLPSGGAKKTSLFLEALVEMSMQRVENQLLRQQQAKQQEAGKKQPAKKARTTLKYDSNKPPESQTDDPPKLSESYAPELSSLLETVSQGMFIPTHVMAEVFANEENKEVAEYIAQRNQELKEQLRLAGEALLEENEQLRAENEELAEKVERHLQQARDSYARQRQENLEEYREKRREYMREYRARKKLEAESKKPPEKEDDSSQLS